MLVVRQRPQPRDLKDQLSAGKPCVHQAQTGSAALAALRAAALLGEPFELAIIDIFAARHDGDRAGARDRDQAPSGWRCRSSC